ncbi:MAG: hypothetical protein WAV32_02935 [Halobacteriota archaeon]
MKRSIFAVVCISILTVTILTNACINLGEVPVINLKAEVSTADGKTTLKIVSVEQGTVSLLRSPKGTSVNFPSVDAKAIINSGRGGVSYWAAKEYRGAGTYEFVLGFEKDREPQKGDLVKVIVRATNEKGKAIAGAAQEIIWK